MGHTARDILRRQAEVERTRGAVDDAPGGRSPEQLARDPVYSTSEHVDSVLTPEARALVGTVRAQLRQYARLRGLSPSAALPDPATSELLEYGEALYRAGNFTDAAETFLLGWNRLRIHRMASIGELVSPLTAKRTNRQDLGVLSDSTESALAVERLQAFSARSRWYSLYGGEAMSTRVWFNRVRTRQSAAAFGPDVMILERLSFGSAPLPMLPPASVDSAIGVTAKLPKRAPIRETFHVCTSDGRVDHVLQAATQQELLTELPRIGGSQEFAGTVVVSGLAAKAASGFRDAFPRAFVTYDPSLEGARGALERLRTITVAPGDTAIALLLPRDAAQQQAMGLSHWNSDTRREAWDAVLSWMREAKGTVVTWRSNRFRPSALIRRFWNGKTDRDVFLDALDRSPQVLVLFAHGARDHLVMPDGTFVTTEDLRVRHFKAKPIVLLLSCEGAQGAASDTTSSLAESLKEAGATAVWGFEQKVDVRDALMVARRFQEAATKKSAALSAMRAIDAERTKIGLPQMRLKVEGRAPQGGPFVPREQDASPALDRAVW